MTFPHGLIFLVETIDLIVLELSVIYISMNIVIVSKFNGTQLIGLSMITAARTILS